MVRGEEQGSADLLLDAKVPLIYVHGREVGGITTQPALVGKAVFFDRAMGKGLFAPG
jgi:hypothetical protein